MMASPIGMEHLVLARRLVLLVPKLRLGTSMGETPFHVAERETEFRAGVPKRSLGTRSEEERDGSNDRSTSLTAPTPVMFRLPPSCEYPASRASSRTSGRT